MHSFKSFRKLLQTHPVAKHKAVVVPLFILAITLPLMLGAGFTQQTVQQKASEPIPTLALPFNPVKQEKLLLTKGWNLVTLPLVPQTPVTASQFLNQATPIIPTQTHESPILQVSVYINGKYKTYTPGATDFALPYGMGIAVLTSRDAIYLASGSENQIVTIPLNSGWNLIGIPTSSLHSGRDVLTSLSNNGLKPLEIDDIEGGYTISNFSNKKSLTTLINGQMTGQDFSIVKTKAYWIKVERDGVWKELTNSALPTVTPKQK